MKRFCRSSVNRKVMCYHEPAKLVSPCANAWNRLREHSSKMFWKKLKGCRRKQRNFLEISHLRLTSASNDWELPLKPQLSARPKPSTDSSTKEQADDEKRATMEQEQSDKNPLDAIDFLSFHFP